MSAKHVLAHRIETKDEYEIMGEGLRMALAQTSRELRSLYPHLYEIVDRIQGQEGWRSCAYAKRRPWNLDKYELRTCIRCGTEFAVEIKKPLKTCGCLHPL